MTLSQINFIPQLVDKKKRKKKKKNTLLVFSKILLQSHVLLKQSNFIS